MPAMVYGNRTRYRIIFSHHMDYHGLPRAIIASTDSKAMPNLLFPIGPMHKIVPASSTSLQEEETSCIRWLDRQSENAVIYINLGCIAIIDANELAEMAWGLANSKQPFLWLLGLGQFEVQTGLNYCMKASEKLLEKETIFRRSKSYYKMCKSFMEGRLGIGEQVGERRDRKSYSKLTGWQGRGGDETKGNGPEGDGST
ncbi:hypothetical protein GH714_031842 [Hevea brasiliensis]|uniref:Uncharacterized protein n=1 Tax=Hevea brasiliensis TaxID=3981 RepID=A0A6A6LH32_HEVBR|nr:hypothetical protein GH714_031842 [Hevea brasiliensis]